MVNVLQEGVFVNLHQLTNLYVGNNNIRVIEPHVFDESANLSALTSIDLYRNDLTQLDPWPLVRAQHRPMTVGLRDNSITKFTNVLQWSFNCTSTKIFETHLDFHNNNIEHITDIMNSWNIDGQLPHHHQHHHHQWLKWKVGELYLWGAVTHRFYHRVIALTRRIVGYFCTAYCVKKSSSGGSSFC